MSAKRESASIMGVGVAPCAACCAGPILGVLAAIGIGTAAGIALFGAIAIVVGAVMMALVVIRRQRRSQGLRSASRRDAVTMRPATTTERTQIGDGTTVARLSSLATD